MCVQVKKKYTYLSMCSCCNVVSKYSSVVKKHLQRQHKGVSLKESESFVIPIRLENRFEKKIRRTLDRDSSLQSLKRKQKNLSLENRKNPLSLKDKSAVVEAERKKERKNSSCVIKAVKCSVCNDEFSDHFRYLNHLVSSHSNLNVKVRFICPFCDCAFQCLKDIQKHFEKDHIETSSPLSYLECIDIDVTSAFSPVCRQCPYCNLQSEEHQQLHDHVRETHSDHIEMITINAENVEKQEDTILPVYNCRSCQKSFHTVQDLGEHVHAKHAKNIANSKPARKRKPPKWLENDTETMTVKKTKTTSSSRNAEKMVVDEEKMTNDTLTGKKNSYDYCGYIAKTDLAVVRHIKTKHFDSKQDVNKSSTKRKRKIKESFSETEGAQKKVKESNPEIGHSFIEGLSKVDKEKGNAENENLDVEEETNNGMNDTEFDLGENDNANFGDSDDDYEPDYSGSDSEESLKESNSCMFCNHSFTSEKSLNTHIRRKHKSKVKNDISVKKNIIKSEKKDRPKKKTLEVEAEESKEGEKFVARYKCPFCELRLHHYEYIRSHICQSHPEVTNFRINTKEMVKESLCEEDWELFKCPNPNCDFLCKKKQAVIDHIAGCGKGKFKKEKIMCTLPMSWMDKLEMSVSLICPYCDIVQQGKVNFENHLKEHYSGKTFEVQLNNALPTLQLKKDKCPELECTMCPYCEIVTTQKAQLSKHFKRFHSNEIGTDTVITCILTNQSSVKEKATLIIRDTKQTNLIWNKIGNSDTVTNMNDEKITETERDGISDEELKMRSDEAGLAESVSSDKDCESASQTFLLQNSRTKVPGTNREYDTNKEISEEKEQAETVYIQSPIPVGMYICPLCDNFKTCVKKEIKLHMNGHNSQTDEDVDSIYTIPDTWIKMEQDSKQCFKCQLCDFEDVNLTLAFRHVLDCHKDITVKEQELSADISGPLFEILNLQIEGVKEKYERQKYKCTACSPGHIFKTRKGLQLHMKTRHTNSETPAVYETMYKMLDLVSDSCDTRHIYLCCICKEGLPSKLDLISHFNADHSEKYDEMMHKLNTLFGGSDGSSAQPNCEVCCKQFTDEKSLKHHLILHVNKLKPTCYLCDLCFTNSAELECHNMEVHSKSGEMCYKCGAMFSNVVELNRHVKSHEAGEANSIKQLCQYCGTSVIGKNMKKHLVDKHIELISCECDICTTQEAPESKKSVSCDQCNAVFCTWYVLRKHKYDEHNLAKGIVYKCGNCSETFSNKRDQSVHSHKCGQLVTQPLAGTNFDDSDLAVNGGNVTEVTVSEEANIDFEQGLARVKQEYISVDKGAEKSFSCKLCGKAFSKMIYICNHLRRMHTKDETKRYRCKVCKMGFVGKKEFGVHCHTTHIGLRQHQCNICQKRYKTAAHLKEHSEIHTSQTYTCGFCGLEFRQRGAVLAHVVHHDKVKPFKCLYCGKGHTTHGDLQRHMNSYNKGSKISGAKKLTFCNYCSKEFPNHNALVKHFQIHIPINPFKCSVCHEMFSTFRQMYTHKSKKMHFTDVEIEEGRNDLQAPGNRFRKYQVSKSKSEMTRKGNTFVEDAVPESTLSIINDEENIIEIEIGSSVTENDEKTKAVIEEFERDVIRSMLDADPETLNSVDFQDMNATVGKEKQSQNFSDNSLVQDGYNFEIQGDNSYIPDGLTMQDMYVSVRRDAYADTHPQSPNKTTADNSDKFASMVAKNIQQGETVPGKAQTFQASDGSIIHVCVIKPDK
ncbi:zinc finger protein 521-like [Mercenaria mercenaria]|uniref:zinc finger protein 521-like n=1 Tax=Mercenaria mercenaria TaxID=6596 RepID=UPI00234E885B|nr:zinc finger protein 521-like [Mercenaria mercenaria]